MLNGIRRNRRRAVALAELPVGQSLDTLMTCRPSFEPLAHLDATTAVDALPETQRTIFLLAAVEGFTCKEISAMQAIPVGTVTSRPQPLSCGVTQSAPPADSSSRERTE
jgi:DNA-directed RNA polymerase specialized sigma24 family protein